MVTPHVYALFAGLFGALFGSFVAMASYRLPTMLGLISDSAKAGDRGNLMAPRSYCPACKTPIKPHHLIPLYSYFALRAQCSHCGAPISPRYFIIEALGAVIGLTLYFSFGLNIAAFCFGIFLFAILALAVIDAETGYLPDAITLPLIILGIAFNGLNLLPQSSFVASLTGAIVGYAVFRLIGFVFEKLRGAEGLGQGDAKLLAAIGAWLGVMTLPVVVFVASLSAMGGVAIGVATGKPITRKSEIAFGPALALAALIITFMPPNIF